MTSPSVCCVCSMGFFVEETVQIPHGGFHKWGVSLAIIHFERWDFPL